MEMKAITDEYSPGESAVLAELAGANIILFSHTRKFQEEAYTALLEAAESGRLPMEKIESMKKRYPVTDRPSLDIIRQPRHLTTVLKAARKGIVLLKSEPGVLPINQNDTSRIALLEFVFNNNSKKTDYNRKTGFATMLHRKLSNIQKIGLDPWTPSDESVTRFCRLVSSSDLVIVATRNAYLIPQQYELANRILSLGKKSILICLRNPYDAGILTKAETVLCTLGDSTPSLTAVIDILIGKFRPTSRLHVPLTMY